jgi:antitoxin component HigA of HigAB toxin-antitoxin module
LAWFDFRNGNVVVKNPDSEILQKMWSLAQLSEVLRGKKGLSVAMVQSLRARFHVSARIES